MPELPEVETIARLVRPGLEGREITGSTVLWERTLGGMKKAAFSRAVRGTRIRHVGRRAKWIVMDLERAGELYGHVLVHLRMTGRLHVEPTSAEVSPYARVMLELDGEDRLDFIDVRKFGRFRFTREPDEILGPLGPEPLGEDFTAEWLVRELKRRKRLLKPLLLDQEFLAGLGNIYVDESLHKSGLHPLRRSDEVRPKAARRLHEAIRTTLEAAIEHEGSSFDPFYRTPEGQPGSYQDQFQVYGRDGKPCRKCGSTVRKIVVGQRGTHLCRRCQPTPRRRSGLPSAS